MSKISKSFLLLYFNFLNICLLGLILTGCQKDKSVINPNNLIKPQLIFPLNNSSDIKNNITLKWHCEDAEIYSVLLDTFPVPKKIIATNINDDSLKVGGLQFNKTYYWKVIAHLVGQDSVESTIWNFRIKRILPFTFTNIEINFPKADLRVDWFWHWNDFDGSYQRRDTLRNFFKFSINPFDFQNHNIEYFSEKDSLYLSISKTSNIGYDFRKDSLNGYIKLDTVNQCLDLKFNFYMRDDFVRNAYDFDKQLTISKIEMLHLPFVLDNQGILHTDLHNNNAIDFVNDFSFDYYRNQWDGAAFGGETLKLIELFGFENNIPPKIRIIF